MHEVELGRGEGRAAAFLCKGKAAGTPEQAAHRAHLDGSRGRELVEVREADVGMLRLDGLEQHERLEETRVGGVLHLGVEADGAVRAAALGPLVLPDRLRETPSAALKGTARLELAAVFHAGSPRRRARPCRVASRARRDARGARRPAKWRNENAWHAACRDAGAAQGGRGSAVGGWRSIPRPARKLAAGPHVIVGARIVPAQAN